MARERGGAPGRSPSRCAKKLTTLFPAPTMKRLTSTRWTLALLPLGLLAVLACTDRGAHAVTRDRMAAESMVLIPPPGAQDPLGAPQLIALLRAAVPTVCELAVQTIGNGWGGDGRNALRDRRSLLPERGWSGPGRQG
jgi:hypothetical protein